MMQEELEEQSVRRRELRRGIEFGRFVAFCNLVLLVPWAAFFLWRGDLTGFAIACVTSMPSVLLIWFLMTPRHYAGRVFWFVALVFNLLALSYLRGSQSDIEVSTLWLLALPFLLFSSLLERRSQFYMMILAGAATVLALSMDFLGLHAEASIRPEQETQLINLGIRLSIVTLLLAQFYYFVRLNRSLTSNVLNAIQGARQASKAKGQFLASMSHEIRTPMNGMIGMLEVLEAKGLGATQKPLVETIRNSALSLLRIIDDILDASKIEAGKMNVSNFRMELIPVIEGAAATLRVMSDENQVQIRHFIHPDVPHWIVSDSGRLRQILLNLLSNAVKYSAKRLTGRDGVVWFLVDMDDDGRLRCIVRDNGIGMSAVFQDEMFQPFSQGEAPAKRQVQGTGLGLVITQSLVHLMGGQIAFKSTEGEGTEFVVTLPVERAEGPSSFPDISGRKLIAVSYPDDPAEALLETFATHCGVKVRYVNSLEAAIDAGQDVPRPVFLLTHVCPDVDQPMIEKLQAAYETAGFIIFARSRAERYGRVSEAIYRVQVRPILTTDFVTAVEEMTRYEDRTPPLKPQALPANRVLPLEGAYRILAVEDNAINQAVLAKQLELLGVEFDMAANGQEALSLLQVGKYDLVLTDCFMPIMDGFELTAAIRTEERMRESNRMPIIALTADAIAGKHEECRAAGMDDTLIKPLELAELRETLAQNLRSQQQEASVG
jgi:signal transduction histidine kinase/DNA-binding response OmpR family regulator